MVTLRVLLLLCLVCMVTAEMEGYTEKDDWWAYQWYMGEPFRFKCQSSDLNFTSNSIVVWGTPTIKALYEGYDGDDYKVSTVDNIIDVELLVKNIKEENHGVYTCTVYTKDTRDMTGKVIYGLNIHSKKYRDMTDKYRSNIRVAFVATAVFVVPVATIFLLWNYRYEVRVEKLEGKGKMYVDNEKEEPPSESIAATVMSSEGKGAYDNPDPAYRVSTQL